MDLVAAVERSRLDLPELTARNRLIHTPLDGKRKSWLDVVEAHSEGIYQTLVHDGRFLSFAPADDKPDDEAEQERDRLLVSWRPNRASDWRFKQGQLIPPPRSSSDRPLLQRRSDHSGTTWRINWRWISHWLLVTYMMLDTPTEGSRELWASPEERFRGTSRLKNQTGSKRQRLPRPKRQLPTTIQTGPKRQPGPITSTANRRPRHAASANPFERPFFKRSTRGCRPNGSTKISSPSMASPASTGRSIDLSKP